MIGVDMTEEQLAVARRHQDWHAERFGHANTDFRHGYIEDLAGAGIPDASVDVVVSNCVVNLSPDKPRVLSEIFRVLKPGGELYFSDIFSDRRLPASLLDDPVLVGECLAGALYTEDFRRALESAGCPDARTVAASPVTISDPDIERKIGFAAFTSRTIRAFKLPLEDRCEDYGQVAVYHGTIAEHPRAFDLDDHHRFHTANRRSSAATPPTCLPPPATPPTSPSPVTRASTSACSPAPPQREQPRRARAPRPAAADHPDRGRAGAARGLTGWGPAGVNRWAGPGRRRAEVLSEAPYPGRREGRGRPLGTVPERRLDQPQKLQTAAAGPAAGDVSSHLHTVRTGELPVGVRLHLAAQPHMPDLLPALGPHSPWPGNALLFHAAETPPVVRGIPACAGLLARPCGPQRPRSGAQTTRRRKKMECGSR